MGTENRFNFGGGLQLNAILLDKNYTWGYLSWANVLFMLHENHHSSCSASRKTLSAFKKKSYRNKKVNM